MRNKSGAIGGRLANFRGTYMSASSLGFRAAVLFAIVGIGIGIAMAMSQDHSVSPAHAHINLLGWVSTFLIGIFYRLHPAVDATRLALIQMWVWIVGTIVTTTGVTLIYLGNPGAEPIAAVGSLIVFFDLLLFAYLVFRSESSGGRSAAMAPAE
jgi:FtsH-binding integral membrane protein